MIENKGWKRNCPGGLPGLQNRRAASSGVAGGFDPHSLPPFIVNCLHELFLPVGLRITAQVAPNVIKT
jgi:hypothetical protein